MAKNSVKQVKINNQTFTIQDAGTDMRVLTAMGLATDTKQDEAVRIKAFNKIMCLYFGDIETAMAAQDAFAEEHDGKCDIEAFMTLLNETIGSLKN